MFLEFTKGASGRWWQLAGVSSWSAEPTCWLKVWQGAFFCIRVCKPCQGIIVGDLIDVVPILERWWFKQRKILHSKSRTVKESLRNRKFLISSCQVWASEGVALRTNSGEILTTEPRKERYTAERP